MSHDEKRDFITIQDEPGIEKQFAVEAAPAD